MEKELEGLTIGKKFEFSSQVFSSRFVRSPSFSWVKTYKSISKIYLLEHIVPGSPHCRIAKKHS